MNDRATMHVGPLGSSIHVLRADAQTVEQLAEIDWNRHFQACVPRSGARPHHPDVALAPA